MSSSFDRRDFLRQAGAVGAALGPVRNALAKASSKSSGRVLGANDRINIGVIGVGGRGIERRGEFRQSRRGQQFLPDGRGGGLLSEAH